jgi:hypothetical protein
MSRTRITPLRLEPETRQILEKLAGMLNCSLAEVVRRAVRVFAEWHRKNSEKSLEKT